MSDVSDAESLVAEVLEGMVAAPCGCVIMHEEEYPGQPWILLGWRLKACAEHVIGYVSTPGQGWVDSEWRLVETKELRNSFFKRVSFLEQVCGPADALFNIVGVLGKYFIGAEGTVRPVPHYMREYLSFGRPVPVSLITSYEAAEQQYKTSYLKPIFRERRIVWEPRLL